MAKAKNPDKLTAAEERAVIEYLQNGGNQTKAFRRAFPQSKNWKNETVWSAASKLFAQPKVQTRVKQLQAAATERAIVTESEVLREATRMALADIRDLHDEDGQILPMDQWPSAAAAAVESVEYGLVDVLNAKGLPTGEQRMGVRKVKLAPKNSALDKLFKHLGLYEKDNQQKGAFSLSGWENLPDEVRGVVMEKLHAIASSRPGSGVAGSADSGPGRHTTH